MKNKTTFIKSLTLFILLFTFTLSSYSQSSSNFELHREISMTEPDSEIRNINLSIEKNTSNIHLEIFSEIKYGSLTIKILNPKNEIVGEFSIESIHANSKNKNSNNIKEIVSGKIQKVFNNPTIGKWLIEIDSDGVVGNVKLHSIIISNN
ncbi:MAG: hypothetical protein ABJL44_13605 [Algibacter sp.]